MNFRKIAAGTVERLRAFLNLVVKRIDRESVARTYIKSGNGIEIGALHNPLKVGEAVDVRYVDRMSREALREQYPELASENLVPVDILDDGERLATIADGSLDFVIANHFLEHAQDPFLAVKNMLRVLKAGGVLYAAVPDKRYTFDRDRDVTGLDHLIRDYEEGPGWSRKLHYEEWVRCVNKIVDPGEYEATLRKLMDMEYSIHFHVWDMKELVRFLVCLRDRFEFDVELILNGYKEILFVLRKT